MVKKVDTISIEVPVPVQDAPELITENETTEDERVGSTKKAAKKASIKNVAYTDVDDVPVPKRKVKYSRIFDVYCVRHGAEINIDDHETVCRTDWNAQLVAREFCAAELEKEGKVTGRRDIFVRERGVTSVKTYGYVVRRKRVEEKDVKKVQFPGKSHEPATFNFNTNVNHARINKAHLRSFRQQCMKRLGATDSEIENVPLEADKKNLEPESDSEPEEDAPEPKVKVIKKKKEVVASDGDGEPQKVTKKASKAKKEPKEPKESKSAKSVKPKASTKEKTPKVAEVTETVDEEEVEKVETVVEPKKTKVSKKKKVEPAQTEDINNEVAETETVNEPEPEKPKVKKSKKKAPVVDDNAE